MLGFLGDLLGLNAGNATKDASWQNKDVLKGHLTTGNQIIDKGAAQAGGYLQETRDLYSPLAQLATGAGQMYGNALGLNGAGGSAEAKAAFQTSPGYQFSLDQGLQALDRRRSAGGSFQSGGADADTMAYAIGTADQAHGSWLDRLANPGQIISSGIPGMAGAINNQANLATGTASQKLGLRTDFTNGYLGANNQYAEGEEANKAGIASLGSNLLGMAGKAFGWGGF